MERIEAAIMRTILYADVFQFPLNLQEIQRFLIHDEVTSIAQIEHSLKNLSPFLTEEDSYFCLKNRQAIVEKRKEREAHTQALMHSANRYGKCFAWIPFVRMVALTGALAVRNPASLQDDFDYMLVTRTGRVWTARLFAVILVRLVRFMGRELCPNYVLAEDELLQKRQDIFVAHEIAQMKPIFGLEIYQAILEHNEWAKDYLPNIEAYASEDIADSPIKSSLEWIFGGRLGDWLEHWEFSRKSKKFVGAITEKSSALVDAKQVKGHFKDNGHPILEQYTARLRAYGLLDESLAMAGD